MLRLSLLLLFLIGTIQAFTQCQPLSERDFQMTKRRISQTPGGYAVFQASMDLSRSTCFTSNQAREIANYLANDRDKLDFLRSTFPGIVDKENFTDVMDAFRLMSSAFKLYHLTMGSLQPIQTNTMSQNPNCQRLLEPSSYTQLLNKLNSNIDDRAKASAILTAVNACIYTQQATTMISSLRDDNIRLDILKRLTPFIFDIEQYSQAGVGLSSNTRALFLAFLQNPQGNSAQNEVSEIDFEGFLEAVHKQSFDQDKVNYIKTYMQNAYLNTSQIKMLMKDISFDSSRIDIAKFLFDKCVDKPNYYKLAEMLSFSSSKTDLNNFVKSKM